MWYIVRLDSSRVATRHSSPTPHFDQGCDSTRVKSNYIPHSGLYIVVYEPRQRAAFRIPFKSVSFKSFDYRRHRACAIATILRQIERCLWVHSLWYVYVGLGRKSQMWTSESQTSYLWIRPWYKQKLIDKMKRVLTPSWGGWMGGPEFGIQ